MRYCLFSRHASLFFCVQVMQARHCPPWAVRVASFKKTNYKKSSKISTCSCGLGRKYQRAKLRYIPQVFCNEQYWRLQRFQHGRPNAGLRLLRVCRRIPLDDNPVVYEVNACLGQEVCVTQVACAEGFTTYCAVCCETKKVQITHQMENIREDQR